MKKAGFLKRLAATFIDSLIFIAVGAGTGGVGGLLWFVYETVLVAKWEGYTVGKKVVGIRVVPTSGHEVNLLKAFIRAVAQILSTLPLFLGYLWMLWDDKSQTWHDKIADTYVVEA
jgi:uncharacterized RDD family membrane protein YckC